jgi:hypothetical protein
VCFVIQPSHYLENVASNDRITDKWLIVNILDGNMSGLRGETSLNLPRQTDESTEK